MKQCTQCKETKPFSEFSINKQLKSGLRSYCKTCQTRYDKERYAKDVEGHRQRVKDYRNGIKKESPKRLKMSDKEKSLKYSYGLSLQQYEDLKQSQNYSCYICKRHESEVGKKGLVVDHCHNNGMVRKLLCGPCNTTLGLVKENVQTLGAMIQYLKSF